MLRMRMEVARNVQLRKGHSSVRASPPPILSNHSFLISHFSFLISHFSFLMSHFSPSRRAACTIASCPAPLALSHQIVSPSPLCASLLYSASSLSLFLFLHSHCPCLVHAQANNVTKRPLLCICPYLCLVLFDIHCDCPCLFHAHASTSCPPAASSFWRPGGGRHRSFGAGPPSTPATPPSRSANGG